MEREILTRCAEGWTLTQVAKEQGVSLRTVKYVLCRVRWRVGARNTTAAVAWAIRAGWI